TAGLAASAGLDLRLDHNSTGKPLSSGTRLLRGVRDDSARHRNAVFREEFLRLMFEQVHEGPSPLTLIAGHRRLARHFPPMKPSPRPKVALSSGPRNPRP